uniref:Uncharacterized protein n=1 Tax=Trichobilharzia regenti TaxID=157069 RepID=A0AA85IXY5_TRIRE|nr:unnamed protein product [Trichobilharzia regenti]
MDIRIPAFRAVRMVIHWFSHWNNRQRQLFLFIWDNLEEIYPLLSSESQATTYSNNHYDNVSDILTDIFFADLISSNLQIDHAPSTVFEFQLFLFRIWYPQWPMEQRLQLINSLEVYYMLLD